MSTWWLRYICKACGRSVRVQCMPGDPNPITCPECGEPRK